ncbi:OX-2 membrane glycoprotein [Anolis carolinensis]|uniref:Ig-like domain-containing protein n=1 Tax=Anolis carolinensis TaxID=28377 RepID=G1KUW3_ANOCA|nr:PREDICTED: OX-2 membrane glycoprotein [Anolis carolinensis]|eukprot:XP_008105964.1 PREDICTED: OX-2 membrane glycoprotein [Anolis carolinensis]
MIFTSFFVCIFWTDVIGAEQVIHKSVQTVTVGTNVTLRCQLAGKHDIVQVTWQKEHEKTKTNIATYSESHGSRVLGKYQSNVQLFQSGMTISAITFHMATLTDEGCYDCIFNTFPLGAISAKTCLRVYALTEPRVTVKHVIDPDSAGEGVLEISCSATGKPEPVITWKANKHLLIKPKEYVIQHSNKTMTVVSNFTHISSQVFHENPITCVIHHPSLNTTQELTVPVTVMEETPNKNPGTDITLTISILVALILLFFLFCCCWKVLRAEKRQCWVFPAYPGTVVDRKYIYTLQEVPVKSHPEGKLPDR